MSLKIIIHDGKQYHNFVLNGGDVCKTVADVKQFCYRRFPHLQKIMDLMIYWNDKDGDKIRIMAESDYRSFLGETEKNQRQLYVEVTNETDTTVAINDGCKSMVAKPVLNLHDMGLPFTGLKPSAQLKMAFNDSADSRSLLMDLNFTI